MGVPMSPQPGRYPRETGEVTLGKVVLCPATHHQAVVVVAVKTSRECRPSLQTSNRGLPCGTGRTAAEATPLQEGDVLAVEDLRTWQHTAPPCFSAIETRQTSSPSIEPSFLLSTLSAAAPSGEVKVDEIDDAPVEEEKAGFGVGLDSKG